jgi:hypothetical protein
MTFGVAFVVPSDQPLSPVAKAFADLVGAKPGAAAEEMPRV